MTRVVLTAASITTIEAAGSNRSVVRRKPPDDMQQCKSNVTPALNSKAILMAQIKPFHLSPDVKHRASSAAPSLIVSPTKRRIIIHDTSDSEQETNEGTNSTANNAASHVIKLNGSDEDQRQRGQSAGASHKYHSKLLCLHHHRWRAIAPFISFITTRNYDHKEKPIFGNDLKMTHLCQATCTLTGGQLDLATTNQVQALWQ